MTGQLKSPLLTDLASTQAFLEMRGKGSISALLDAASTILMKPAKLPPPTLRHDIVDKYVRQLEQTLGDEPGFAKLFSEIENNSEVGNREAEEIAKRFAGKGAKNKPAAMKKMWSRHHNLMTFRAKSESRAGRSAA